MDVSKWRWCHTFSDGRQQVEEIPRAERMRTAATDANVGKVDDMIIANRRITIDEVAEELGISHEQAQNIIHDILRYTKVSARWVPRQLTSTHQEQRMAVSLEHLVRYHEDGNDFLVRGVASPSLLNYQTGSKGMEALSSSIDTWQIECNCDRKGFHRQELRQECEGKS
ncbi:histone-lysine N-methyltransferase SETMAR [Trichonephila inaurata madagascariensis]|uniref:Histone-lysine N-methyltransferase SETMAR n=1 Tax=Trichonephila inaurata madagascariensis TaxID=2747483 RepID=A0A8X6X549_9ARAC|nr:histone-lysine N-methyltransferase SETMAR [Trichonephila inaurata madagascariensis]